MSNCSQYFLVIVAIVASLISPSTHGQTVINIPPDIAPSTVGADTIVNLLPGGVFDIRGAALASDGAVVNVLGGRVGELVLKTFSEANVEGGGVHERFWAQDSGKINLMGGRTGAIFLSSTGLGEISGGAVGKIGAVSSSSLVIIGVNFAIDGVPVAGLDQENDTVAINLPPDAVLTAILADGTPFGRYQEDSAQALFISDNVLTLRRSANPTPPIAGTIKVDAISDLLFAGSNQTLQVIENGRLQEHFRAGPGSRIEVNGGRIDSALHVIGGEVVLNSGTIDRRLKAFDGATIDINNGLFDGDADIFRNSVLNVRGGQTGRVTIRDGGTINVSGGNLFSSFGGTNATFNITGGTTNRVSTDGGTINLLGGKIIDAIDVTGTGVVEFSGGGHTDNISARAGGQVVVRGSEFRVNGVPLSSPLQLGDTTSVNFSENTTFSGVYADGTPFVFHGKQEEIQTAITAIESFVVPTGPPVIDVPNNPSPQGIRNGQILLLNEGGVLPDYFTAGEGSTLLVVGGEVGDDLEVIGANVHAVAGKFNTIDAFVGSVVNLEGNAEWQGLDIYSGAVANINGGQYTGGHFFRVVDGATVNIYDGDFRGDIAIDGANANISGGEFEGATFDRFSVAQVSGGNFSGGLIVRSGSELVLTGGDVEGLSSSQGDTGAPDAIVQVDGARVGRMAFHSGSTNEILSGTFDELDNLGGTTHIRGGAVGDSHEWLSGSVDIHGYDFQVNGSPIAGLDQVGDLLNYNYTPGSTISGILADGTPFNLTPNDSFKSMNIYNGVLKLNRSDIPSLPANVVVTDAQAPYGAAAGQNLVVETGGVLRDNFVAGRGSVVEIRGGEVGHNLEADRSTVTIFGGVVGDYADAFEGSVFTIAGGVVGSQFEVHSGATLVMLGGELGGASDALSGSSVIIQGGIVGSNFDAVGANVTMSAGEIDRGFTAGTGAMIVINGGIIGNGFEATSDAQVDISGGQIGSSFDVRQNAQVNINGGVFSGGFTARGDGVVVNFAGGQLDRDLEASGGAEINIRGGQVGNSFDLYDAFVNLSSGEIGDDFRLRNGAKVNMVGGTVGDRMTVFRQAEIVIAGGEFGDQFRANDGSLVVLEGYHFKLDGVLIPGLTERGSSLVLEDRGGALLTGFLDDRTPFQFQLNENVTNPPALHASEIDLIDALFRDFTYDYFAEGATLQLVLAGPEPILVPFDIKPGSESNSVNLKSEGVLPVAILSTEEFDVQDIDLTSLLFGDPLFLDGGGMAVSPLRYDFHDVSGDGLLDLTLKFSTADLVKDGALGPDSIEGLLTGLLLDGTPFEGMDLIRIVPPNGSNGNSLQISTVPEPTTLALALAALCLAMSRRRSF